MLSEKILRKLDIPYDQNVLEKNRLKSIQKQITSKLKNYYDVEYRMQNFDDFNMIYYNYFHDIPKDLLTPKMVKLYVKHSLTIFMRQVKQIPKKFITYNLILLLIKKNKLGIYNIPKKYFTYEIAIKTKTIDPKEYNKYLREKVIHINMANAIKRNNYGREFHIKVDVTEKMLFKLVKHHMKKTNNDCYNNVLDYVVRKIKKSHKNVIIGDRCIYFVRELLEKHFSFVFK